MTNKIHCEFYHEFDGKCCPADQPCMCADLIPPALSVPSRDADVVQPTTWASVLIACSAFWLVMLWLAWRAVS